MNEELSKAYQQGKPDGQLDFFKLELNRGAGLDLTLLFHNNGVRKVLNESANRYDYDPQMEWLGQTYDFAGVKIEGMKYSDGGRVNSPTLTVANRVGMQDGYMGALCLMYNNLKGAKLTRHMTTRDIYEAGRQAYITQVWTIERMTDRTASYVNFMLKTPLDFRKQLIPTRLISPYCTWAMRGEYRGEVCGYTGTKYFNERGEPVDDVLQDKCGGLCTDCELRFGEGNRLSHGGFLVTFDNGNW